jgi:hypothetical protein
MSIGNLKTEGNKGNNFPWQLKMLQGLQALIDSGCCDEILPLLQPQERKANIERVTSGPSAIAGPIFSYSVANVGAANGTVNSVLIKPGEIVNFDASTLNNFFDDATVDGTGTELLVTWITLA